MAGVEQQRQALAGMFHQQVELFLGLDGGCHVVMVGDRHALSGAPFAEGGHFAAIGLDLFLGELALGGKRRGAVALDGAGGLAIDDAGSADRLEQGHLLRDAIFLRFDVAIEQQAGEPAAANLDAVLVEDGAQDLCVHRKPAAGLHAGKAGLRGLGKASFQRNVAADFRQVVVPPGDGCNAEFGFHGRAPGQRFRTSKNKY